VHFVDHRWFIVSDSSRVIGISALSVKAWYRHDY